MLQKDYSVGTEWDKYNSLPDGLNGIDDPFNPKIYPDDIVLEDIAEDQEMSILDP